MADTSMAVYCLGCGDDLTSSPRDRRSLSNESSSSAGPRERVLAEWTLLLKLELQSQNRPTDVIEDLGNKGKMCRKCFYAYEKYSNLQTQIKEKLCTAVAKMPISAARSSPSTCAVSTNAQETPTRKRSLEGGNGEGSVLRKRQAFPSSSFTLGANIASPPVTISVAYKCEEKHYPLLTPRRRHMGKSIARGSKKALIDQCFSDRETYRFLSRKIGRIIHREMKAMCSATVGSVLKSSASEDLIHFKWDKLMGELNAHAPTLLSILQYCTDTKAPRNNRTATIGTCAAILLNFRFRRMSLLQKIIAVILHAGHSGKQVYERLKKLNLTISHKWTIHLQAIIGKDFDAEVKEWRDSFIPNLTAEQEANHDRTGAERRLVREDDDNNEDDESSESSSSSSESDDSSDSEDSDTEEEELTSTDGGSECESDESESDDEAAETAPQVAKPPQILEPSLHVKRICGVQSKLQSYRLCGDNIDKTVRSRYMRLDKRNMSLHYFHSYAVQNRIDVSDLPDVLPDPHSLLDYSDAACSLVPSSRDDHVVKKNIATLISRVLATHLKFFKVTFEDVVDWHMKHEFYQEMSKKSVVVPLGVLLKNENKSDDMVDIMSHLHQYVPTVAYSEECSISTGETVLVQKAAIHPVLVGGDQLTAARARAAQKAKVNSQTPIKKLSGIVPVAEDWHAKANFLSLIWRYYYSHKSTSEHGTLYQLRNVINRTNVVSNPLKDFNACDDFFVLVMQCHILAAALEMLEMKTADDVPSTTFVPDGENTWMQPADARKDILDTVTIKLVETFVNLDFNHLQDKAGRHDKVNLYATQLLSIGCFYLEYSDAIREGDGNRVLRCWRYMLPMFVSSGRKNYAIESLNLLVQHDYSLPPRQAAELIWSRFINLHGIPGRNIPNDLHMEHLNRICKTSIKGLGANKTEKAIIRVGKALGTIAPVLMNFDIENGVTESSGAHRQASIEKDMKLLMEELQQALVFRDVPGRKHKTFPNPRDPLHARSHSELTQWIVEHIKFSV